MSRKGSWLSQIRGAAARLRGDPGAADLDAHAGVVAEAARIRPSVRELDDRELASRAAAPLRASDDAALGAFLGVAGEVARRRLGLDPFDEQLLAAATMLRGGVVDMATGEGKTLVGFLAASGLASLGRRVHVLVANDYLASRDAAAGAPFFAAFGLSSAAVTERLETDERRIAHGADVVYATVHQVGYDLLRDRQRTPGVGRLVGELDACLIDEIDAVLVDDAMVPLVLAGTPKARPPTTP